MRNNVPAVGALSVEQFLAFESASPTRHEFVAGRVYAMVGTTARHNRIATNIHAGLRLASRGGPCSPYIIDLKVRAARDRIYYPDCVVVCTPHAGDTLVIDEPCLIAEVTSRSTRRIDRSEKLDAYLAMPSLRAYLVVEHDRRHVTLYSRATAGEWSNEEIVTTGNVMLPCPAAMLSLDDIYEDVELPPLRVREDPDSDEDWPEYDDVEVGF